MLEDDHYEGMLRLWGQKIENGYKQLSIIESEGILKAQQNGITYNKYEDTEWLDAREQLRQDMESRVGIYDDMYQSYVDDYNIGNIGLSELIDQIAELRKESGLTEEQIEKLREAEANNKGKVAFYCGYNEALAHEIYAASDLFLMPSLFEPCGLSQLMSLRFGTLPIVRETGGLKDTVEAYNEYEKTGTGFSFANYNAHEMMGIVRYAERIFYDKKREWNKMVERAMTKDYSWENSAKQYEDLYKNL